MNLATLQKAYSRYVLEGDSSISEYIIESGGLSVDRRLSIYANAYRVSLLEALRKDYPVLNQVLGEDNFDALGLRYIEAFPSRYYSLRWLGRNLTEFMGQAGDSADNGYLVELAAMEWSLVEAFDLGKESYATEQDAKHIVPEGWPDIKIDLHPSAQIERFQWNTLDIWQTAMNNETHSTPRLLAEPIQVLIWRKDYSVRYRELDTTEARALEIAKCGTHFAGLCEQLVDEVENDNVPITVARLLQTWLTAGVIAKLRCGA